MKLYHTSFTKLPNGVCSHFGAMEHGFNLLDGMFAAQTTRMFDGKQSLVFASEHQGHRAAGRATPTHVETPRETFRQFAKFVEKATVFQVEADIDNSLRLHDCWGDDPIGSGGLQIFRDTTSLPTAQGAELLTLFHPFSRPIYPIDVVSSLTPREIERKKSEVMRDPFFGEQLQARKKKLGTAFAIDEPAEVLWMHLTMQLRQWALKNGFDSFVYRNDAEGTSDDSHVTLKEGAAKPVQAFRIDTAALLDSGLPKVEGHMGEAHSLGMKNPLDPIRIRLCDVVDMKQLLIPLKQNDFGPRPGSLTFSRPGKS